MPRRQRNRPKRNGAKTDGSLVILQSSHAASARGDVVRVNSDTTSQPRSWLLTENPPRMFLKAIHWVQLTSKFTIAVSGIGAVVEANQSFSLTNNMAEVASYAVLFDQYCIHSAAVRIALNQSASLTGLGRLHTAIDYDNVGTFASETLIMDMNSCDSVEIVPGKSVERVVRPCIAPAIWAGGAFSGYSVARQWLNMSSTAIPHYGVRILTAGAANASTCDIFVTVIVGLRNNI